MTDNALDAVLEETWGWLRDNDAITLTFVDSDGDHYNEVGRIRQMTALDADGNSWGKEDIRVTIARARVIAAAPEALRLLIDIDALSGNYSEPHVMADIHMMVGDLLAALREPPDAD